MRMKRRDILKSVVVAAGTVTLPPLYKAFGTELDWKIRLKDGSVFFPQSIASGDPKEDSVIFWTRAIADDRRRDLRLWFQLFERDEACGEGEDHDEDPDHGLENSIVVSTVVRARSENDGCVRVKVVGLNPKTTYHYRFVYRKGLRLYATRMGRTRTAPAVHDKVPVRFALANCQDLIGKYYNAYLPLLTRRYEDLDFILHVGDFVYETTGDPLFQGPGQERNVIFSDTEGAIKFGDDPDNPDFLAARSLSNYREIHQTYRSDPVLQAVLAKFPLIATWDDHEFSDDNWQDHSTYFDGRGLRPTADGLSVENAQGEENPDEQDTERKLNAEKAWFEYMPIDDDFNDRARAVRKRLIDNSKSRNLFPATRIYRDFRFGQNVYLALTDYRTFRPDQPVAEDAFPGAVLADEPTLRAKYNELFGPVQGSIRLTADKRSLLPPGRPDGLRAYSNWEDLRLLQQGAFRAAVKNNYMRVGYSDGAAEEKTQAVLTGLLDAEYLNSQLSPTDRTLLGINASQIAGHGLTNYNLHKIGVLGIVGSRYAQNPDWYELWRELVSDSAPVPGGVPEDEEAYGRTFPSDQDQWLQDGIEANGDAAWRMVASSVSSSSIIIDLGNELPDAGPGQENEPLENLRRLLVLVLNLLGLGTRFYVSCDQWDGFPNKRYELHKFYREMGNVVLLAGDIHSSWINDFSLPEQGALAGFTGTSISSATFGGVLLPILDLLTPALASSNSTLAKPGAPFAGFARGVIAALESGAFSMAPDKLAARGMDVDRLKTALNQTFAIDVDTDGFTPDSIGDTLGSLLEQLFKVLDLYFFDRNHESTYLKTDAPELRSKIKSRLVGLDSGSNGLVVFEIDEVSVLATYLLIDPTDVEQSFYQNPGELLQRIRERRFVWDGALLVEM